MTVVDLRPPGWLAENFRRDRELLGTPGRKLAGLAAVVLIAIYPSVFSNAWVSFASVTAISVITVTGLQILMGTCGQVSVGQSAFMGMGAYAGAFAATKQGWPLVLAIIFAGASTTLIGLVFGLPATRIRGFYLALTTMAAQFVFVFTVPRLPESWLGANNGIAVRRPVIFGQLISTPNQFYFLIVPLAALLVVIAAFINASHLGRQMVAVRENELAASVTGVHVVRTKIIAFGVASFYAGTAGALLAYLTGIAHFEQFTLFDSIWFLGFLVVGGAHRTLGAVLGTVALSLIREWLNHLAPLLSDIDFLGQRLGADVIFPMINVAFGVLIIVTLLYQPRGLAHLYSTVSTRARRWPLQ